MSENNNTENGNPLLVAGGIALMLLGGGLVLTHPRIRQAVLGALEPLLPNLEGQLRAGADKVIPDIERYWKLRDM
jgi:LPXTG-motif cell wall-anchored protein